MSGLILENEVIERCAPTLAGLKSATLFNYTFSDIETLGEDIDALNANLNPKGVYVRALKVKGEQALIYVFRYSHLSRELSEEETKDFLKECGYKDNSVEYCIRKLILKLKDNDCFPHEIGLFLGYPLEDVKDFIEYKGKCYKCCGIWKVYHNAEDKIKLFEKYNKCCFIYRDVFMSGRTIAQMTVSA
ncbi:MAG: DUF3793 family protein [Lachnospiraceae bacterium]|nr:DUF3793 family protein [Lachnospiraceae bacterium]